MSECYNLIIYLYVYIDTHNMLVRPRLLDSHPPDEDFPDHDCPVVRACNRGQSCMILSKNCALLARLDL